MWKIEGENRSSVFQLLSIRRRFFVIVDVFVRSRFRDEGWPDAHV